MSELSPEQAERCRKVFTNKTALTGSTGKNQPELLKGNGLCELAVLMMLMEVTTNAGQKIRTLVYLAS